MGTASNKRTVLSGLFWSYGERITAQGISLLVSIILARLLSPNEYGIISVVMIFITLCDALVTGGFGNALIQKKEADELDFSTMLVCSMSLSVVLYIVLFFAAPSIAKFYDMQLLQPVVRVLGLRVLITGINTIQQAKIRKAMQFKKFFFSTLFGTVISAFVGIIMAYYGFGVWALVAQYLTNATIDTFALFIMNKWVPKLCFSMERAKQLMGYGWKVLATTMVYTVEGNFRSLIIGKVFGSTDLAYYDQGKKFPNLLVSNINTSISKVMLPALSEYQDNLVHLKKMCRRSIRTGVFLLCPMLIGLISVADTFVTVILTDKWAACVPYLRILTIVFLVRPLTTTCQQAIMAIGRSDITLKIEIIINVIAITLLCVSVFWLRSILMIAWSNVLTECVSFCLFMYYSKKCIGYKHREQFMDLMPCLVLSGLMGLFVLAVKLLPINGIWMLAVQVVVGVVFYILVAIVCKMDACRYLVQMLYERMPKKIFGKILTYMQ
jgi:O-antigen/teichoic acid export membrane protein